MKFQLNSTKVLMSLSLSLILNSSLMASSFKPVNVHPYYGKALKSYLNVTKPSLQKLYVKDLRSTLNLVLSGGHIAKKSQPDSIVASCAQTQNSNCTEHKVLGYKKAREILFGDIHLQFTQTEDIPEQPEVGKEFFIKDIYCLKNFTNKDMPETAQIGPNLIPEHTIMNTEHVWPKSRFKNNVEKETGALDGMKESDLHILYPSDSKTNALRSNYEFAEVGLVKQLSHCNQEARLGYISENEPDKLYFEPPKESKGNVARSLFYFSIRYNVPINEVEETFLRKWHLEDPIDSMEKVRNEVIYKHQKVRNPFIDHPQLVKNIKNF